MHSQLSQLGKAKKLVEGAIGGANDNEIMLLLGKLPGLEAAKNAIQAQIDEIHRRISESRLQELAPHANETPQRDPDDLGVDSIGRIIRRRNLSLETIEKKREVMKKAREARQEQIKRHRESQL